MNAVLWCNTCRLFCSSSNSREYFNRTEIVIETGNATLIKITSGLWRTGTMHLGGTGESIFHLGGPEQSKGIFLMYMKLMTNICSSGRCPLPTPIYNHYILVFLTSVVRVFLFFKIHLGVSVYSNADHYRIG